jgi:NAD(P)H-flavin reductase
MGIMADTAAGSDPMRPAPYRVVRVRRETRDVVTLALEPVSGSCIRAAPGQFNMLWQPGVGEVPISVSGDDDGLLVHTLRSVGAVTSVLAQVRKGDVVGVRGPFGSVWPVDLLDGDDAVIIAGGIGLAPLRPVVRHVMQHRDLVGRVRILVGARTPDDLLFRREVAEWRGRFDFRVGVTVDHATPAWRGEVGVVTRLLERVTLDPAGTVAFLCGPELMMRYAAQDLEVRGIPSESIWVSAERNMKCAVGLCGHCQLGGLLVCRDGAVLRYDRVAALMATREL